MGSHSPLSVLMICPQFHPIVGGYERAALRLSISLCQSGQHVEVWTERRNRQWARDEYVGGIRVRRLFCIFLPGIHTISVLSSLGWNLLVRGRGFDVWHVHQYGSHATLASIMGGLLSRPVVLKLTNTGPEGIAASISESRASRLQTKWLKRMTHYLATSRQAMDEAVDFGVDPRRITILGNGIDTEQFRPPTAAEKARVRQCHALSQSLIAVYVGRLAASKNVAGLLQAWRIVLSTIGSSASVKLVLVGDGPQRGDLEVKIRLLGLGDSVLITGQQTDVTSWFQAADLFVLPSLHEGLSNSMLEAMSCGLPIVTTRVSGCIEAVEQGGAGLLAQTGDCADLGDKLLVMLRSESLRLTCGIAARRFVESHYSMAQVTKRALAIYTNTARKSEQSGSRASIS